MTTLEQARAELRQAERQLAELSGERKALAVQVEEAKAALAKLGINEHDVSHYINILEEEMRSVRAELTILEQEASSILDETKA